MLSAGGFERRLLRGQGHDHQRLGTAKRERGAGDHVTGKCIDGEPSCILLTFVYFSGLESLELTTAIAVTCSWEPRIARNCQPKKPFQTGCCAPES